MLASIFETIMGSDQVVLIDQRYNHAGYTTMIFLFVTLVAALSIPGSGAGQSPDRTCDDETFRRFL